MVTAMTLKSMLAKLVVALLGILTSVEQLSTDLYQPGRWTVGDRAAYKQGEPEALDRSNFPKEMVFGVSSSAYQVPAHSCGVNMGVADRLFKVSGIKTYSLFTRRESVIIISLADCHHLVFDNVF